MSVPVPQRTQGELEVNTRARILCVYTFKILENEKWFPKSQTAFITKLQDCVVEIDHIGKGNSYHLVKRMEAYYKSLWEDNKHDAHPGERTDCG